MSFLEELKRRNVVRVGIAYVVASWLLLQLTEVLTELLEIGPDVGKIVIVLLIIGFIPALIFAWAFEMTPEGIKREADVDRSQSVTGQTGQKLNFAIIGMLVMVAGYFIWESRFKASPDSTTADMQVGNPVSETANVDTGVGENEPDPAVGDDATVEDTRTSIVVLPFVNMSNDPDQEYFSDGLSEEILNALVRIRDLRVISRTSAFAFKDKDLSIPQIAEQLGVSHVLEGSVRKAGNDVRITAQLIEVDSDSHLWSEAYNRSLENVFEIQEEISGAIANQLKVALSDETTPTAATSNPEAYQAFLRGRHLYQNRGVSNLSPAIDALQQAVELDPDFADAWATLAAALVIRGFQTEDDRNFFYSQGRSAARQAISIDSQHGFAHGVLGLLLMSELEWAEANRMLDRAIELNPFESNTLLWKGIILSSLGYSSESLVYMKKAELVDPVWPLLLNWMGNTYAALGDISGLETTAASNISTNSGNRFAYDVMLPLIKGELDTAEENWAASYLETYNSDVIIRALFSALRDSSERESAVDTIVRAGGTITADAGIFGPLWVLGATNEGVKVLNEFNAQGHGLLLGANLIFVWHFKYRGQLSAPGLAAFFESSGIADYWREFGDPDFCRVDEDNIQCGDL